MSNPNLFNVPAPRWFGWFAVFALLAYGTFLGVNFTAVAGGSDSSGYLNAAKLIAGGQLTGTLRLGPGLEPSPGEYFRPLGFIAEPAIDRLVPTYPLGLPAHLALASHLAGWTVGPLLVSVGAVLAVMVLCYFAARELSLAWPLAAAGAVILGVFPVTVFIAIQPLSDVLATAWTLAALLSALRARRGDLRWAVLTGGALAVAVFVRPTNVLFLPALIVLLSRGWRPLAAAALGGLPGALALMWCNHHLYGSPWRMGYDAVSDAFSTSYWKPTMLHFVYWLAVLLPTALLLLPFGAAWRARSDRRMLVALALWFAVPVLVYACYQISHEVWWCLRFILPAVPALILAALLGLNSLLGRRRRLLTAAAAGLALWSVACSWYWTAHFHTLLVPTHEHVYLEVGNWAREHIPDDSVVVCFADSGAIHYYTSLPLLRWDLIDPINFTRHAAALSRMGRPLYAIIFPTDEKEALTDHAPGRWEKMAHVAGRDVWRYAGPAVSALPQP